MLSRELLWLMPSVQSWGGWNLLPAAIPRLP